MIFLGVCVGGGDFFYRACQVRGKINILILAYVLSLTTIKQSCYVPTTEGGGGHSAFGADPVVVGVCVASCLHSISGTKEWILTKLAQTHYWDGKKVIRLL